MLFFILGTPTALPNWILNVTVEMARVLRGEPLVRGVISADDIRAALSERGDRQMVAYSDIPALDLTNVLLRSRAPVALAYDQPLNGLRYVMDARDLTLQGGVRFISQSYATLEQHFASPSVTVFPPRTRHKTVAHFLPELEDTLNAALSEEQRALLIDKIAQGSHTMTIEECILRGDANARPMDEHDLDPENASLGRTSLDQFNPIFRREKVQRIVWPPQILHNWDNLGQFLGGPQDLTGPARILTAGHVMHLPAGQWRGRVEMEIRGNISGNEIVADFLSGDDSLGGIHAPLPPEGTFEFVYEFAVNDPFPPNQLRIVLKQGAIEGEMIIRSVEFDRID